MRSGPLETSAGIRQIQNNAGIVLSDMGFLSEAAECFGAAARADRRSMDYRLRHAFALYKAGRLAEAVPLMDSIVKYNGAPPDVIGKTGDAFAMIARDLRSEGEDRGAAFFEQRARLAYAKAASRAARMR